MAETDTNLHHRPAGSRTKGRVFELPGIRPNGSDLFSGVITGGLATAPASETMDA